MNHKSLTRSLVVTLLALLFACQGQRSLADDASQFLSVIEDVPLMAGLTESVDDAMVFETGAGRVAETQASGPISPQDVASFYRQTLPQLGWTAEGPFSYLRAGERLRLEISQSLDGRGNSTLLISLSPTK